MKYQSILRVSDMMEDAPSDHICKTNRIIHLVFIYNHNKSNFYAVKYIANIAAYDKRMFHEVYDAVLRYRSSTK